MATRLQSLLLQFVQMVFTSYTYCNELPEILSIFLKQDIISPHLLHTKPSERSELLKSRSLTVWESPWASSASLSISPILIPPPFFLPLRGCCVRMSTGPVERA